MFSSTNIFIGIVTGAFGLAYFIYGKKRTELLFLVSGIALMVYPYMVSNVILSILIGLALLALPFLMRSKANSM
jgi:hypothetical protein